MASWDILLLLLQLLQCWYVSRLHKTVLTSGPDLCRVSSTSIFALLIGVRVSVFLKTPFKPRKTEQQKKLHDVWSRPPHNVNTTVVTISQSLSRLPFPSTAVVAGCMFTTAALRYNRVPVWLHRRNCIKRPQLRCLRDGLHGHGRRRSHSYLRRLRHGLRGLGRCRRHGYLRHVCDGLHRF